MRFGFLSAALTVCVLVGGAAVVAMTHPDTPLPSEWNPVEPLRVADPRSPLTRWKATVVERTFEGCLAAMDPRAVTPLMPLSESNECGIADRVRLMQLGGAQLVPLETDCAVALRLALWERHDLQDVARETLGARVVGIKHLSSYACRRMRTLRGEGRRMSSHATGMAIDVSGFTFSDGRAVDLLTGWEGSPNEQAFLRAAQKSACKWFGGVLGPDFNALHADHFHMQVPGRGFCR
ncbi:MAG: extensin family protein [Boseongicola sp.]|nr:extensin family protein [Boseongicola sp.]